MAIIAGMFWIIFGICYVLYKIGSEESRSGMAGGIITVLIPIAIIATIAIPTWCASTLFGDYGVVVVILVSLFALITFKIKSDKRERKRKEEFDAYYEDLKRKVQEEQTKGGSNDNS